MATVTLTVTVTDTSDGASDTQTATFEVLDIPPPRPLADRLNQPER